MDLSNIKFPLNYLFNLRFQQTYDIDESFNPYNTDINWDAFTEDETYWFDELLKNKECILDK